MLPTWLSDLRGASLGLLLACAAHAAGWRCAPLVYGLLGVCSVGFGFSIAFYVHTTRVVFNRKPNRSLGAYYQHFMLTRPLEAAWRFLTAPLRVLPDFHILGETRTGTTTLSSYLREIGCIGAFSPWIVPFASDKDAPRQKLAVRWTGGGLGGDCAPWARSLSTLPATTSDSCIQRRTACASH
ncbi:unnamed protein product [Prorocentrum cordatum]|uniref:Sulfotransferase n=1 Tax=Prorocentrum cordatum TaxID=2364126 RepID=A0ABN9S8M4_9DINO|nr:unnamed protein product [Polarella glacialis]